MPCERRGVGTGPRAEGSAPERGRRVRCSPHAASSRMVCRCQGELKGMAAAKREMAARMRSEVGGEVTGEPAHSGLALALCSSVFGGRLHLPFYRHTFSCTENNLHTA